MAVKNRKNKASASRAQNKRGKRRTVGTTITYSGEKGSKMIKKPMGRPARLYPPRTDATVDELVGAMFSLSPAQSEAIRKNSQEREYRCVDCKRLVCYPETFYNDHRCESCHQATA